jgi:hypothetical protein
MTLLLLEALGAGLLFVGIIWWTMFSGRKGGELPGQDDAQEPPHPTGADRQAPDSHAQDQQDKNS